MKKIINKCSKFVILIKYHKYSLINNNNNYNSNSNSNNKIMLIMIKFIHKLYNSNSN